MKQQDFNTLIQQSEALSAKQRHALLERKRLANHTHFNLLQTP
jgi:hypothetical protein